MNKKPKGLGSIDVEEERDFWLETGITQIDVYEDLRVKSRAVGFIWPEERRIILEE